MLGRGKTNNKANRFVNKYLRLLEITILLHSYKPFCLTISCN